MATETVEIDHMKIVRERLNSMTLGERTRLALDVDLSITTLYNIKDGKDAKYSTVMKLYEAVKDMTDSAPKKHTRYLKGGRKARAS